MKGNNVKEIRIKDFINDNYKNIILGIFVFFIIYGKQIYSINVRIDTETVLNNPTHLNFITLGRQGALFTRLLFEQLNFNPYFAVFMALIILSCNMILLGYIFNYIGKIKFKYSMIMYFIFIVHPIWMEQFYFNLQILEMSVGIFITFSAVFFSYKWILEDNKNYILLSIIFMIWAFSTYQLFMILYITMSVFCFVIIYRDCYLTEKSVDISIFKKIIFKLIILFFIAVLLNGIITRTFFLSNTGYLESQILWNELSIYECIDNIITHMKSVVLGNGIFYSYSYIISLGFVIVFVIFKVFKFKNAKLKWLYILAILGLQLCPFLLTIYSASIPVIRAQFILPFVISGNLLLFITAVSDVKNIRLIAYIIIAFIFVTQTQGVMSLQYTDDIRFEEDMRLASDIYKEVEKVSERKEKPVAFIGTKNLNLNAACVMGEMIGRSIFNHDSQIEPHYVYSSSRSVNLMSAMGMPMQKISEDQMIEARKTAISMPIWPEDGSVIDVGGYVIVKLSNDQWYYDDILQSKSEKVEINNLNYTNNSIEWCIDNAKIENKNIKINGWILDKNYSSKNSKVEVYIKNDNNDEIYKLSTIQTQRYDVTNYFNNEGNYDDSGFITKGSYINLDDKSSKYTIILSYENNNSISYVDTGIKIN